MFENLEIDFSQLMDRSFDAKMILNKNNIVYANDAFLDLFGFENKKEIVDKNIFDLVHPDYYKDCKEREKKVLLGEVAPLIEQKMIRSDGKIVDVEIISAPYIHNGITIIQSVIRDISERKTYERLLRQSEKLSVIGELASGIVHEIRNPLTCIKGFIQLMKTDPENNYRSIILNEVEQIEKIANELLYLAKPREEFFTELDIGQIVKEAITFSENEAFKKHVQIHFHENTTNVKILGDKTQLKQVFLNLIKNALEAILEDGDIYIDIRKEAQYVYITINDNGVGIPKDKLPKIGQSFFTSKKHGNGLGLMVTYNIVKNHNGDIEINSIENVGTSFTIKLLLVE